MNRLFKCIIAIILSFAWIQVKSQILTENDFRLLVDGKSFPTPTVVVTVDELMKMKIIDANFSWIYFKGFEIAIDFRTDEERDHVYDGTRFMSCEDHRICEEAKMFFKKLRPTSSVTFMVYRATNKSGAEINIQPLTFRIK